MSCQNMTYDHFCFIHHIITIRITIRITISSASESPPSPTQISSPWICFTFSSQRPDWAFPPILESPQVITWIFSIKIWDFTTDFSPICWWVMTDCRRVKYLGILRVGNFVGYHGIFMTYLYIYIHNYTYSNSMGKKMMLCDSCQNIYGNHVDSIWH